MRLLFQGNAIRVGPRQFPRVWHLHTEVTTTFDWDVPVIFFDGFESGTTSAWSSTVG